MVIRCNVWGKLVLSVWRHIGFSLVHLLPQFAFYVTVFYLFCYCFPLERVVYYLLETSIILFCYCCFLVLSALWFSSLALNVSHLVLFLLFLSVLGFLLPLVRWSFFPTSSWCALSFSFSMRQFKFGLDIVENYKSGAWSTWRPYYKANFKILGQSGDGYSAFLFALCVIEHMRLLLPILSWVQWVSSAIPV